MNRDKIRELTSAYGSGVLEVATAQQITGWAWDPDSPDESIAVEVMDGDSVLAVVMADTYRADVEKAGLGNGRHGFSFAFGPTIFPNARHTIRVRRAKDGVDLASSPQIIEREGGALDRSTRRYVESLFQAECAVARRQLDLYEQPSAPDLGELSGLIDTVAPSQWVNAAGVAMSAKYPPVLLPVCKEVPKVSVIVPVYGKFQLTYDCIKSIAENLPENTFEVIVVDDCSKDETLLAPLVFGGTVRVIRNETNLGFVKGCNRGAELSRGEYLFFLNNDTLVKPGWLDQLVKTFQNVDNVGIAGSKLLFGDGSLQEVGGIIWRMGDGWNWGRNANAEEPKFSYLRDADYVSGAALMIPKPLFDELGGFDLHFAPAYYEDTDLCFRVRKAGKRVVVQPQSVVVHLEGQTSGTSVTGSGMKRFQAVNHRKFFERWKNVLANHRFNAQQPELECERTVKKRALFIDDSVPTPDQDAGSNAAFQHMKSLMRLGYKVTFIPADNMAKISPYTEALQAIGVECIYYPFYWSVEEYFRKNTSAVDLVYLHRFTNGTKYAGMVRRHQPKARIVYNVADLHHLRMEREAQITGNEEIARSAAAVRHEELSAIAAVDATIVHSAVEKSVLADIAPKASVHVVPWAYALRPVETPVERRQGVVFVGGYRHVPNVDAARWLVEEVMPHVWREIPDMPVSLVGSHMPEDVKALGSSLVEAVGYVPDVRDIYEQRLLSVAPLRYGAGVKGKVLEAFAAGVPCVMTACAAEGVELPQELREKLVGDDARSLAKIIIKLHKQRDLVTRYAELGREMMEANYSNVAVDMAIGKTVSADVSL
jgi:O-antigen biosynthesis protein